jgi:hypothetical protein
MSMCGAFNLNICPDLILAAIALAFAAGFYFLYMAITKKGRRRRRRDSTPLHRFTTSPLLDALSAGTTTSLLPPSVLLTLSNCLYSRTALKTHL